MYMSYDLSHYLDGDISRSTSFTVSDDDAINCAHMLAAGFNTISRKMMGDFVLAVVDTKAGTVQYDGKIEQIKRDEPWSVSKTFNFEASTDADTFITLFDNDNGRLTFPGKFKLPEESKYAHVNRDVLEAAYGELEDVKSVLFDAGVETIPADAGVKDLLAVKQSMSDAITRRDESIVDLYNECARRDDANESIPADAGVRDLLAVKRAMSEQIAKLTHEREQANAAARAEMIKYVKGAYVKLGRLDAAGERDDLQGRMRGMLDVLAKFLAVTGEADHDERHAVARRLCGIPEGVWV